MGKLRTANKRHKRAISAARAQGAAIEAAQPAPAATAKAAS